MKASSSNGRAPDSKSGCWGFESLLACQSESIISPRPLKGDSGIETTGKMGSKS